MSGKIRVCVAGATGWTGSAVAKALLAAPEFALVGGVARKAAGRDLGEALGLAPLGTRVSATLAEALKTPTDAVIDFTRADAVKGHALAALGAGVRVVIGTSGLADADYREIDALARAKGLGAIACGNFSITAALAKRFALIAAAHLPSWELVDYAHDDKVDAPSGTVRELAESLAAVGRSREEVPVSRMIGDPALRGASVAGTRVHSVRLPGYAISFEAIFGKTGERLTIRHDSGSDAAPYVAGTLLAASRVGTTTGLVRGLDALLFDGPAR